PPAALRLRQGEGRAGVQPLRRAVPTRHPADGSGEAGGLTPLGHHARRTTSARREAGAGASRAGRSAHARAPRPDPLVPSPPGPRPPPARLPPPAPPGPPPGGGFPRARPHPRPFLDLPFGAYLARDVPPPDDELTRVGPRTPCGEYLRRFWQPVAFARDLGGVPLRIRIMGEDLVVFRDGAGRVGLLQLHCTHPPPPPHFP